VTVPVYEIYKVGEAPRWLEGLNLLAATGLNAAVIPHFNNAEGGNHDTRYCYLGAGRLQVMEAALAELDSTAFVLGVDEHTGLILDLGAGTATVVGLGVVTVRADGRSAELATGSEMAISRLAEMADDLRHGPPGQANSPSQANSPGGASADADAASADAGGPSATEPSGPVGALNRSPLLAAIDRWEAEFEAALSGRDAATAVGAILGLDDELQAWSRDTLQSDEADRGRAALRGMIVRLGEAAGGGLRDPAEVVGPFVEALLELRTSARHDKRWADADRVRNQLVALGVETHDAPDGTTWSLGAG
jgi:hypothetical protein